MLASFRGVVPCLVLILIGFFVGRVDRAEHEKTLSSLIFFVFSPCLVFTGIHRHVFSFSEVGSLALAAILSVIFLIPVAVVVRSQKKETERGYLLPMLFSSTGTLLMPFAYLLYGNEGLAKAAMFHLFSSLFFYLFGTWLTDGSMQPQRFFRNPTFFAAIIALLSVEFKVSLPDSLEGLFRLVELGISLVGYGAIPFLLISFGYPFCRVDRSALYKGISGGVARVVAGPLAAFIIVLLLRHIGLLPTVKGYDILDYIDKRTTEAVIIVAGTIPGSISCYFINRRHNPETASDTLAILLIGSIAGVVSIPFSQYLINRFILSA